MQIALDDIVKMRKPHPCGSDLWKVVYVGADVKLKCEKCGRVVMLERPVFDKRLKAVMDK